MGIGVGYWKLMLESMVIMIYHDINKWLGLQMGMLPMDWW
jgi:hypothetical protein